MKLIFHRWKLLNEKKQIEKDGRAQQIHPIDVIVATIKVLLADAVAITQQPSYLPAIAILCKCLEVLSLYVGRIVSAVSCGNKFDYRVKRGVYVRHLSFYKIKGGKNVIFFCLQLA